MLAPLACERARGQYLVGEGDEEDAECRRRQVHDVVKRGSRQRGVRQASRDRADDRDTVAREVEPPGDPDGDHDHEERAGQGREEAAQREQRGERGDADRNRGAAHVPELPRHIREPLQRIARVDVETEQVAELGDHEHDRDAVQVADQHRPGEIVGHPAEAQHPGEQEAGRDEQGEHRSQLGRLVAAGDGERKDGGGDERRDRAFRADDQPPRGAEQHVGDRRQEQGVQPVHRREPGQLAVGHRRGQGERSDGEPGDEVTPSARDPVAGHLLGDRDGAYEKRLPLRRPERRPSARTKSCRPAQRAEVLARRRCPWSRPGLLRPCR